MNEGLLSLWLSIKGRQSASQVCPQCHLCGLVELLVSLRPSYWKQETRTQCSAPISWAKVALGVSEIG